MSNKKVNWEPDIKKAIKKSGDKTKNLGIDAQSDERYAGLGKTVRKKKGFWRWIAILIILLIIFDAFFMNGEIFINVLKNIVKSFGK